MFFDGPLHMDMPVLVDQQELAYICTEWSQDVIWKTYWERWMIGMDRWMNGEREREREREKERERKNERERERESQKNPRRQRVLMMLTFSAES